MARRVVFDTNILVSGYLWKGPARTALEIVRSGECIHLVSKDAIDEFVRVLSYRKFRLNADEIEPIVRDLLEISEYVHVKAKIEIIKSDPADNIFLALAADGEADAIVSGDRHVLDCKVFRGISIIPLRKFLSRQFA